MKGLLCCLRITIVARQLVAGFHCGRVELEPVLHPDRFRPPSHHSHPQIQKISCEEQKNEEEKKKKKKKEEEEEEEEGEDGEEEVRQFGAVTLVKMVQEEDVEETVEGHWKDETVGIAECQFPRVLQWHHSHEEKTALVVFCPQTLKELQLETSLPQKCRVLTRNGSRK
jgi:hypothetical protein